jgi:hypothetical protein
MKSWIVVNRIAIMKKRRAAPRRFPAVLSDGVPDDIWCYPPNSDEDDWRLCKGATNAWLGVVETRAGDEIMNLTEWAVEDFAAAYAFAQDTCRRYNLERFYLIIGEGKWRPRNSANR